MCHFIVTVMTHMAPASPILGGSRSPSPASSPARSQTSASPLFDDDTLTLALSYLSEPDNDDDAAREEEGGFTPVDEAPMRSDSDDDFSLSLPYFERPMSRSRVLHSIKRTNDALRARLRTRYARPTRDRAALVWRAVRKAMPDAF